MHPLRRNSFKLGVNFNTLLRLEKFFQFTDPAMRSTMALKFYMNSTGSELHRVFPRCAQRTDSIQISP